MNARQFFFSCVAVGVNIPMLIYAQGLVPCGTKGDTGLDQSCQTCHVLQLINGVTAWLVGILSVVVAIMIIVAGFRLISANGNPSAIQDAKKMISNALIGFVIVLAAWLLIDLMMKSLLDETKDAGLGPWNNIKCTAQPNSFTKKGTLQIEQVSLPGYPTDQSRGTAYNFSEADTAAIASLSASEADAVLAAAGAAEGLSAEQIKNMQALMRVESGGCRDLKSEAGALGCMQIMPDTAMDYDPALKNLSAGQLEAQLLDPNYNLQLGAKIYADLYNTLGQDEELVYAAYNGGKGALDDSVNCAGKMRWECEWDGSDCLDGVGTDCRPNTGYVETRNYVPKVAGVASNL